MALWEVISLKSLLFVGKLLKEGRDFISDIKQGRNIKEILRRTKNIETKIETLAPDIYYAPQETLYDNNSSTQRMITNLRQIRQILLPVQRVLGSTLVVNDSIMAPEKFQKSLQINPGNMLINVQEINHIRKPEDPDMIAFLFNNNMKYWIGWQKLGMIELMFDLIYKPAMSNSIIKLRYTPYNTLSGVEVVEIVKKYDFYCCSRGEHRPFLWSNPEGKGIEHDYKLLNDGNIIFDASTGLTWQRNGSLSEMDYSKAEGYIKQINIDRFAGYSDWRIPTIEEAMSLMEFRKNKNVLYINQLFCSEQIHIWTSDSGSPRSIRSGGWYVDFSVGLCQYDGRSEEYYVRAVRS